MNWPSSSVFDERDRELRVRSKPGRVRAELAGGPADHLLGQRSRVPQGSDRGSGRYPAARRAQVCFPRAGACRPLCEARWDHQAEIRPPSSYHPQAGRSCRRPCLAHRARTLAPHSGVRRRWAPVRFPADALCPRGRRRAVHERARVRRIRPRRSSSGETRCGRTRRCSQCA